MLKLIYNSLNHTGDYLTMSTPENHIEEMRSFAKLIELDENIEYCIVDDWGRDSNFTLILEPKKEISNKTKNTTNTLKGIVRRLLKTTDAHLRSCFPPEATGRDFLDRKTYNCSFWKFDIDFKNYNPNSNSF